MPRKILESAMCQSCGRQAVYAYGFGIPKEWYNPRTGQWRRNEDYMEIFLCATDYTKILKIKRLFMRANGGVEPTPQGLVELLRRARESRPLQERKPPNIEARYQQLKEREERKKESIERICHLCSTVLDKFGVCPNHEHPIHDENRETTVEIIHDLMNPNTLPNRTSPHKENREIRIVNPDDDVIDENN